MIPHYEGLQSLQSSVTFRLEVVGLPPVFSIPFARLVSRWSVCSGEEWTIQRIKSLKVDLLRVQSNLPPLSTWVKKKNGSFAGVIGSLFRYASLSDKNFIVVLQSLMVYSIFQFSTAKPSQLKKFSDAVRQPSIPIDGCFSAKFSLAVQKYTGKVKIDRPEWGNSLILYRGSPTKTCPVMPGEPRRNQSEEILANFNYFRFPPEHSELYAYYEELYLPVLRNLSDTKYLPRYLPSRPPCPLDIMGGRIGLIQEPGGKLRSVANPYLVHQLALKPIGDAIYKLARRLPWDCTHDQSLPFQTLQDHLSKRAIVHSVDLSSATDRFPLSIQIDLLKAVFGPCKDVELIETLSRSVWTFLGSEISWSTGQPLGLFPSFGMFTVTHGFLLWFLNGCSHNNMFFVLGDDVVILNDNLHKKYMKILSDWNVPWSPDKSISSDSLCEFAGKVITDKYVITQMKWRQISDDNFIDLCSMLGSRSRALLRRRQKAVFDKIAHLIKPFGLGFNPLGIPLEDRVRLTDEAIPERKLSSSLMGLHGVISSNLYLQRNRKIQVDPVDWDSLLVLLETFDKKVRDVLQTVLPFDSTSERIPPCSLQGFSTIPEVAINHGLPHETTQPSRVTQLDRYESILQLL